MLNYQVDVIKIPCPQLQKNSKGFVAWGVVMLFYIVG